MTTTTIHDPTTCQLISGTQEIEMRQINDYACRCGKPLTWTIDSDREYSPSAECDCGMSYYAWPATVKIEGTDRGEQ